MITGITMSYNSPEWGFPIDLSLKSWTKVCDEIVVMTFTDDPFIGQLLDMAKNLNEDTNDCVIKVRAIESPKSFDLLRFYGYYFASSPDWVIHFDADYLIAPSMAEKLRSIVKSAPDDTDVITYRLVYLNRTANRMVMNPDMKKWLVPFDGVSGEYPFIVNPRRQVYIIHFTGVVEQNFYVNFEGVISLNRKHWGQALHPKMFPEGIDPYKENCFGYNIIRSNINVEHLSFSIVEDKLMKKLKHSYWVDLGIDYDYVVQGQENYPISYPLLEEAGRRYA